jgi:uncharacterized protein YkwD
MPWRGNPRLVPTGGASASLEIAAKEVAIGSAPGNDLVIGNSTVSRRHATIARRGDRVRLTDLGATNGTYVNGRRISEPIDLNNGDEVRFGAAVYRFADAIPVRPATSRTVAMFATLALIFFAGFAVTLYVRNLDRLQDVAELSTTSTVTVDNSPSAAASSASPAAISTVALEPPGLSPAATPAASSDTAVDLSSSTTDRLWLDPLNRYRKRVGLAPVTENPRLSHGDYLHSRYIVKNFGTRLAARENIGIEMHLEDPSKPWYSTEGAAAGRAGDVDEMYNPRGISRSSWAIDNWMQSPFHRLPILNPHLRSVGYGYYCDGPVCVASLNLNSDVDPVLPAPSPLAAPIEYPPDGASIAMNSFVGEWPDPLAACPGYSLPAGYPITIQLGSMVNPGITRISFKRTAPSAAALEACAFDGNTYINPDPGTEKMIRNQLINFGAIVIMPRAPLTRGTYEVAVFAGGREYSWSFSVAR